jgi:proteasome lid subunit RPN8/RPN11
MELINTWLKTFGGKMGPVIEISSDDLDKIRSHGEQDYPHECCGFLLGKSNGNNKSVSMCRAVENSRDVENRHNRYYIPPGDYLKVEREARSKNLEIIGFYHSHPDEEARPSKYDLDHSWPFYSYIIVSVKNRTAASIASWQLKNDRSAFSQEEMSEMG